MGRPTATWAILFFLVFIFTVDHLLAGQAAKSVRYDQKLHSAFTKQADLSANLRQDEIKLGRRDCVVGLIWKVYYCKLRLVGNAMGVSAKNTMFHLHYWPPRPFLSLVSQKYYFAESYGAETLTRIPATERK